MSAKEQVLTTRQYPIRILRNPFAGAHVPAFALDKITKSGGGFEFRQSHGIVALNTIFRDNDSGSIPAPNALIVTPWCESTKTNGTLFKFQIGGYRGKNAHYERIADITAAIGTYRIADRPDGVSCVISGRYCDNITVVESYYGAGVVGTIDGGNNNGRGSVFFDLRGIQNLTVLTISAGTAAGRIGYAGTGW